jgi:hypothetical protein
MDLAPVLMLVAVVIVLIWLFNSVNVLASTSAA